MAISGKDGKVAIGANTVVDIGEWSLDLDSDLQETTAFGDQWKRRVAGVKDATGSFSGRWNVAAANQQEALQNAFLNSTTVALRLYVDAVKYYSCTAFIKGMSPSAAVDGVVEQEFTFEADGAVTFV